MIIKENVTIYKCEFCKKELKVKHAMIKHEKLCLRNPENDKACYGCIYLEKVKKKVWFEGRGHADYVDEGEEKEVDVFRCSKLDKFMFPFSIERKGLPDDYPSTYEDQEAMPKECDDRFGNEESKEDDVFNF